MTARAPIANPLENVAAQAKVAVESFVKAGQEAAQKQYAQNLATTKEQIEKASQQVLRNFDDLTAFNKDNLDAVVQAGTILVKGLEGISKAVASYTQASVESHIANSKALLTVKSIKDLVDISTTHAKSSFDTLVAESTKLSELSVKVANEAFAPLNARVNAAVEKIGKTAA